MNLISDESLQSEEREVRAAATLAKAFWGDPFIRYFFPDVDVRQARLARFFALSWHAAASHGACDLTPNSEAAAIWLPPGHCRIPRRLMLRSAMRMVHAYGTALPRVAKCLRHMEAVHPLEPHWYLMTLGTAPANQGKGHAQALLEKRLADCDVQGVPAYLESGTADNIAFYRRFGFEVKREVAIPGAPSFWPMWRAPV